MTRTYYDVLEVDPDADRAEIQRAYREQIRRYHPDVSDRPDAGERVEEVNRAREVLVDPGERDRYDRLGHEAYINEKGYPPAGSSAGNSGNGTPGPATSAGEGDKQPAPRPAGGPSNDEYVRREGGLESRSNSAEASRRASSGQNPTRGPFASLEIVSAILFAGLVGAVVVAVGAYLRVVAPAARPVDGSVLFLLLWAGVAVIAGELAAGGARVLPTYPVRAYALPVALAAAAWGLRAGAPAVAYALGLYGAYAALFRATAAAGRGRQSLVPATIWFVGSVAPALVLYDRLFPVGGLGRDVGTGAISLAASAGPPLSDVVASPLSLAVTLPMAVGLGHALLVGLGQPLLAVLERLRARARKGDNSAGGANAPSQSGGAG